jgi:hypothetical protein
MQVSYLTLTFVAFWDNIPLTIRFQISLYLLVEGAKLWMPGRAKGKQIWDLHFLAHTLPKEEFDFV